MAWNAPPPSKNGNPYNRRPSLKTNRHFAILGGVPQTQQNRNLKGPTRPNPKKIRPFFVGGIIESWWFIPLIFEAFFYFGKKSAGALDEPPPLLHEWHPRILALQMNFQKIADSIKNWMGPEPNGPRSVSCKKAIGYSGFFGVRGSVGPVGDFLDRWIWHEDMSHEQWKKGPWLFRVFWGDEILPSLWYMGIINIKEPV